MSNIPDNSRPEEAQSDHSRPENGRLENTHGDLDSLRIEILLDTPLPSPLDANRVRQAAIQAAAHRGFDRGEIGVRVTSDLVIHQINRDHLQHDFPTDVISFAYDAATPRIEGELVVSVDTARQRAAEVGWSAADELLLYVVHGTLHITGMDDHNAADRKRMRAAEETILTQLGVADIVRCGADQAACTGPADACSSDADACSSDVDACSSDVDAGEGRH